MQKLLTFFFFLQKMAVCFAWGMFNIRKYIILLTNDFVSFEQLSPGLFNRICININNSDQPI